jgi:hypothetical protein
MGTTMTVTVQERNQHGGAMLLVSREEASRLGLSDGQTVTVDVVPPATEVPEVPEDGILVSDADFEAMKREIADLAARGVPGGTSPTLERLIAEAEAEGRVVRV